MTPPAAGRLRLGHWLYRMAAWAMSGPLLAWLWWRGLKEPGYRAGWAERLGHVAVPPSVRGGIWIHVASVGEAQAGLTLLNALQDAWGPESLIWTTQTPAARRLLEERLPPGVEVRFAPLDHTRAVQRFLDRAQPRVLLLLERELWPEWLWQCQQRAIDVVVCNARLRPSHTRRWPYRATWLRERIRELSLVLCADPASAKCFGELGVPLERVRTLGNLKFDVPTRPRTDANHPMPEAWAGRALIVAASTHADDEDALLAGWAGFLDAWSRHALPHADPPLLVLAPRHPQRFAEVARRLEHTWGLQPGQGLAIRSQGHAVSAQTQIWLLDTIGELAQVYAPAKVCLMGGTWAPVGGHNALEPLSSGCPVVFGPHTHQFPDLYQRMVEEACALSVPASGIWDAVIDLLIDGAKHASMQAAGHRFVASQQGSARRTMDALDALPAWPRQPMPPIREAGPEADRWWRMADVPEAALGEAMPSASTPQDAVSLATGSGRGQAYRLALGGRAAVFRHYRRGGWMARLTPDTYPPAATADSRAMKELALLRAMRSVNLPAPEPMAAHCQRTQPAWPRWSRYRADLIMGWLPDTQNLVQCLRDRPMTANEWAAAGRAIAAMHRWQVFHADLNAHNLLLDPHGQVFVVDFDKCDRRGGDTWKAANLARLKRSLHKEQARLQIHWQEDRDWPALLSGYDARP